MTIWRNSDNLDSKLEQLFERIVGLENEVERLKCRRQCRDCLRVLPSDDAYASHECEPLPQPRRTR